MRKPPSPPLILASGSAIRRRILEQAGVDFECVVSGVDESSILSQSWGEKSVGVVARHLAREKALRVSSQAPGRIVLGADQILRHHDELLQKPEDIAAVRERLLRLRGDVHVLHSAASLVRDGDILWEHDEACIMVMRKFSDDALEAYLSHGGEALAESVGGYRLEDQGISLFERIEGDYFAALGLPLLPLLIALRALGVAPK